MAQDYHRKLKLGLLIISFFWSLIVGLSALWNMSLYNKAVFENAKAEAVSGYNKDLLYRRWVSMKGGVYITPSQATPPNPYLANIPERDVTTTEGKKLTLINPAYMTRQVHELSLAQYGTKGHITSLNPINPINNPDKWEINALKSFDNGAKEVYSVETMNDTLYLRYMKPMITEQGCLKCHESQGYKLGQIRGGVSVSVPIEKYMLAAGESKNNMLVFHLLIYFAGLIAFFLMGLTIRQNIMDRHRKTIELKLNEEKLLAQKNILDSIFENSPYIMILVDEDAKVISINKPGTVFGSKKEEEIIGSLTGVALNCFNAYGAGSCGNDPACLTCPIRSSVKEALDTGIPIQNRESTMTFMMDRKKVTYDLLVSVSQIKTANRKEALVTIADITTQKRSEQIINESKNRFESIFELAPYAVVLTDVKEGYYIDINKAFESLSGYTKNEIVGKFVEEIKFWAVEDERIQWSEKIKETGGVNYAEYKFVNKNSDEIIGEVTSKQIELGGREVTLTIIQDITERKKNEELINIANEELKLAQKISHVGSWYWNNDTRKIRWSDEMYNIWGINKDFDNEDLIELIEKRIHPDDKNKHTTAMQSLLQYGKAEPLEFRIIRPDGAIRTVFAESGKFEIDESGNLLYVSGIVQDITERVNAAAAQVKYEQKMSFFLMNNPLAVIEWDVDFKVKEWNHTAEQIFGYTKQEAIGKTGDFIIHNMVPDDVFRLWNSIIHNEGGKKNINENITKDGKVILCDWYNTALKNPEGEIDGVISVARDITNEVTNKEELLKSRNMIQNILDLVPQAIFWKDRNSRYLGCNKIFSDLAGLSDVSQIIGKTDFELPWAPEETEDYISDDKEVIETKRPKHHILEPLRKYDGEKIWIDTSKIPLVDVEGNSYGLLGVFTDITASREAEARQKLLLDTLNASYNEIYMFDAETLKFEFVSNGALKNLGYSMEQMYSMTPLDIKPEFTHEKFAEIIAPLYKNEMLVMHFETVHKRSNETLYPVDVHLQLLDRESGKVFLAVIIDITERKEAEEKLVNLEERFSKIFRVNPAAIVISTLPDYKIIDVNDSFVKLFGFTREELIGHDQFELGLFLDINDHFEVVKHLNEKTKIPTFELKLLNKNKNIISILLLNEIVEIDGEECVISIMTDITDRIAAEEKIKMNEERYRTLFETMAQGVVYQNDKGIIISANKAAERILGLSADQLIGKTSFNKTWESLREDGSEFPGDEHPAMISLNKGISVSNVTMGIRNSLTEKIRWIVINSTPQFRKGEDKPYQVYATFTDITDRKLTEESLKESESRFSTIFHVSPVAKMITRMRDGVVIEVNKTWHNLTGYYIHEALNKKVSELDIWADRQERIEYFQTIKDYGSVHDFEFKLKRKNGQILDMLASAERIELKGELCVLIVAQDITSRKEVERALRESEERYKLLFDLSPDAIFVHRRGEIIMANKEARNLMKVNSESDLKGLNMNELLHPEFRKNVSAELKLMQGDIKTDELTNQVFVCSDGSAVDVELRSATCVLYGEQMHQVFARDITERIKTEAILQEQREKIIAILKAIPDMMFILSADGIFLDYHSAADKNLYADSDLFLYKNIKNIFSDDIANLTLEKIRSVLSTGEMQTFEYTLDMNGLRNFEARLVPCGNNSFLAIVRDITINKRNEIELKKSLDEKDTLLRELFHRTKNNMQVISAMLQLQSLSMSDPKMVKVLFETGNRIKTMSLVHQKLYQAKDLSQINLNNYIKELIELLKDIYNVNGDKIKINLDLEDQLILIDYAVPCGLIINEVVSNAFKYAFPGDRKGNITITLIRKSNGELVLTFKDDGVGLPENYNMEENRTIGMQLINTLVVHQLDGTIAINGVGGVTIEITFCDNQYGIRI